MDVRLGQCCRGGVRADETLAWLTAIKMALFSEFGCRKKGNNV